LRLRLRRLRSVGFLHLCVFFSCVVGRGGPVAAVVVVVVVLREVVLQRSSRNSRSSRRSRRSSCSEGGEAALFASSNLCCCSSSASAVVVAAHSKELLLLVFFAPLSNRSDQGSVCAFRPRSNALRGVSTCQRPFVVELEWERACAGREGWEMRSERSDS
jgi:hypothetical protein